MASVLSIYPRPNLEDDVLTELLSKVPDSKFYSKAPNMVPYSPAPVPFTAKTIYYDKLHTVTVNGREQFKGSPSADQRVVYNPLRVRFQLGATIDLPTLDTVPNLRVGDIALVEREYVTGTGTAAFTNLSATVVGYPPSNPSTFFQNELSVGSYIRPKSTRKWYKVATVPNNYTLTFTQSFAEGSVTTGFEIKDGRLIIFVWSGTSWQEGDQFYSGVRVIDDSADVMGYHIEMEIPLTLSPGKNLIEFKALGTDQNVVIEVTATTWMSVMTMVAKSLYKFVEMPLEMESDALASPWSPRFIEHLLNYRSILPDLKSPHIHSVKLAVKGSMVHSSTEQGVKDFAASLLYNNPILKTVQNKEFLKSVLKVFSIQDELYGTRLHTWYPSLNLARWMAFAKLAYNLPTVMRLLDYSQSEIDVLTEGAVYRLEQHRSKTGPDFRGILDSMPRIDTSIFVTRKVRYPFTITPWNHGINTAVLQPLGIRVFTATYPLTGRRKLATNDGIDIHAPEKEPYTYGFGWHLFPLTSTRFADGIQEIAEQLNTTSGISRTSSPPVEVVTVNTSIVDATVTFTVTEVPIAKYYNFDLGDGAHITQPGTVLTYIYKKVNDPVTYTVRVRALNAYFVPGEAKTLTVDIPAG